MILATHAVQAVASQLGITAPAVFTPTSLSKLPCIMVCVCVLVEGQHREQHAYGAWQAQDMRTKAFALSKRVWGCDLACCSVSS